MLDDDDAVDEYNDNDDVMMMMMIIMMMLMMRLMMATPRKLSFLWSAGAEKSHEGWVQNAHKDRLIYQVLMMIVMMMMMVHCSHHHQLTSAWENSGFDVLLCPAFAMPAAPNALCSRLLPGG